MKFDLKDSGQRQEFSTGAKRDAQLIEKGRYDLISPIALRRLAVVCAKGALKYGERNYEKGMPLSRFIDAGLRHYQQALAGYEDEDHLAQAMWNAGAAIHIQTLARCGILPASLDDLPRLALPFEYPSREEERRREVEAHDSVDRLSDVCGEPCAAHGVRQGVPE